MKKQIRGKEEIMSKYLFWGSSIIMCFLCAPLADAAGEGEVFLIHAKTGYILDDAQICAVPNVALAALQQGYRVVILFDASGITSIERKSGFFGGAKRTVLDKADLPERERKSLSEQMGMPLEKIPRDYGEYLSFIKERGVELYANRTMMLLYKIDEAGIAPAVTPIGLKEMIEVFARADIYVAY